MWQILFRLYMQSELRSSGLLHSSRLLRDGNLKSHKYFNIPKDYKNISNLASIRHIHCLETHKNGTPESLHPSTVQLSRK